MPDVRPKIHTPTAMLSQKLIDFEPYVYLVNYLFYSNQREESQDTLMITVKIHQGGVYCCHFSQDASKVVSCGADRTVKVHRPPK